MARRHRHVIDVVRRTWLPFAKVQHQFFAKIRQTQAPDAEAVVGGRVKHARVISQFQAACSPLHRDGVLHQAGHRIDHRDLSCGRAGRSEAGVQQPADSIAYE